MQPVDASATTVAQVAQTLHDCAIALLYMCTALLNLGRKHVQGRTSSLPMPPILDSNVMQPVDASVTTGAKVARMLHDCAIAIIYMCTALLNLGRENVQGRTSSLPMPPILDSNVMQPVDASVTTVALNT